MSHRKLFIAGAIIALFSGYASAQDGIINFIGTVSASSCSVNSVAGTSGTKGVVDFGTVSSSTFGTAGKSTTATPFNIELTDCAVTSSPTITFEGNAVSTAGYTELYQSGIDGLGIRIEDAGNSGLYYTSGEASPNSGLMALTSAAVTSATAKFNAYLVDYSGGSYSGTVDSDVTFTINYSES
ncbi:fimbrial protein [Enterobacteriaceae bacterium C23F]